MALRSCVLADDVQEGILLTGEGQIRQVFGGGGGANGNRERRRQTIDNRWTIDHRRRTMERLLSDFLIYLRNLLDDLLRYPAGRERGADLAGGLLPCFCFVYGDALEALIDHLVQPVGLHEQAVGIRGDDKAGRDVQTEARSGGRGCCPCRRNFREWRGGRRGGV